MNAGSLTKGDLINCERPISGANRKSPLDGALVHFGYQRDAIIHSLILFYD